MTQAAAQARDSESLALRMAGPPAPGRRGLVTCQCQPERPLALAAGPALRVSASITAAAGQPELVTGEPERE